MSVASNLDSWVKVQKGILINSLARYASTNCYLCNILKGLNICSGQMILLPSKSETFPRLTFMTLTHLAKTCLYLGSDQAKPCLPIFRIEILARLFYFILPQPTPTSCNHSTGLFRLVPTSDNCLLNVKVQFLQIMDFVRSSFETNCLVIGKHLLTVHGMNFAKLCLSWSKDHALNGNPMF